jgi:hypothetical protein
VFKDLNEYWAAGKPTYDPAAIRASTMLAVGEWDAITPPPLAQELFKPLLGAKNRRLVVLSEARTMAVGRTVNLIREIQNFLENRRSKVIAITVCVGRSGG